MAQLLDFYLPYNDLTQYVPQNLRNSVISGLLDNLFNRFMTHDESIPLYGYVGRKPVSPDDRTPRIPQANVERDLNAVIPVLNFKQGTKRYAFTVQDLVSKAKVLGVDQAGLNWLYTQANNYLPPIDIDKFANYYNYFWIAKTLPTAPTTPWNPELLPEYYMIAKPKPSDNQKMNVVCATTGPIVRTGTGFADQTFTVKFITPLTFTLTANTPLGLYSATGSGVSGPQQFTFTLPALGVPDNDYTIVPTVENTFSFDVVGPAGTFTLMTFTISRDPVYDQDGKWSDNETFIANDEFLIDTIFLSTSYTVTPVVVVAGVKGKIKGVQALNTYQTIDGVQVSEGQRVLVKNNSNIENGIYIVGPQAWTRAPDYDGEYITQDALVWVAQGIVNAGRLYESGPGNAWPDPLVPAIVTDSNTNDWQEGNFWVHASELTDLGLTRSQAVQAVRPIIEYQSDLKLNGYINGGVPADSGSVFFKQKKTEFNQLPMFDLYRYDGTHSGLVSSIFFYVEDLTADLDLDLQKRVKTASADSADFVFNHGLVDVNGDLLFYKKGSTLKTIWHAGYDTAVAVDQTFVGKQKGEITELIPTTISVPQTWTLTALTTPASPTSTTFSVVGSVSGALPDLTVGVEYVDPQFSITVTLGTIPFYPGEQFIFTISAGPIVSPITWVGPVKGSLMNVVPTTHTQQQVWTLQAISSTQFMVTGSKTNDLPSPYDLITVGVPYSSSEFSCLITAGTLPYDLDDTFLFRVGNFETPRYVYRDSNAQIYDLYGGEAADVNHVGAYTISRPFVYNPYNEARDEVLEGTLYGHFRGILQNQIPETVQNFAFGGAIKNWSEQQTLLASLLMQKDMTPISMIDMSQRQYETGLNTIADLYKQTIAQYFTTTGVVDIDGTVEQDDRLTALLDAILAKRAMDYDVRTVLYDTTSGVVGIPATLPQLGILPLSTPSIGYDNILNGTFLKHHDGHTSVLFEDSVEFRRAVLNDQIDLDVLRSDGTYTNAVGSFTTTAPVRPYRGELWIRPNGAASEMYAFDVDFDRQADVDALYILPNTPPVGTTVFRRDEGVGGQLYIWDGSNYVLQPSFMQQWRLIDLADTLNQMILRVEERLYAATNPNIRKVDFTPLLSDAGFSQQLERELFSYGVKYGVDPLASDYVATDAFTWNYSQGVPSNFPPLNTASVPARWFNVLKAHQGTVAGVIPTERPNLEPWKLLGFNTLDAWWSTLSGAQQSAFTPYAYPAQLLDGTLSDAGMVRAVKTTAGSTVLAGLQVIDGVSLNNGDQVLLQNELAPANNGVWTVSTGAWTRPAVTYVLNMTIGVTQGALYQNTVWALTAAVPTVGVSPIQFSQVRLWTEALWAYVAAQRPTLRTSVDPWNDALLPPYVSASVPESAFALTTTSLAGLSAPYVYGENSLVETLWYRSMDFGYSLARALFRHDPLYFLGFCWGFNWVEVDGILYDGYDLNTPGHKRFKLHGEPTRSIARSTNALSLGAVSGTLAIDVTITYDAYEVAGGSRFQNFTVRDMNTGLPIGYVREGQVGSVTAPLGIVSLTNVLINDFGQPFHIGDSFHITANADGSNLAWTFTPASSHRILGFGQTFTNALRELSVDTTDSFAIDAFRGWDVHMGYRAGGLVATDDLNVRTDQDTLTTASYELLFKKNEIAHDLWVQGLRITVIQFGSTVTVPENGQLAPKTDGSDWVFRVEGYNPRYQGISFYSLNTAGPYETFNILDQTVTTSVWKHYTQPIGVQNTFLPLTITGIQNVVNFIFGYSMYLEDNGWSFNKDPETNVDAETGRSRTWQLEVEKFVNVQYKGTSLNTGHVLNPFMDKVWVKQPTGLLSEFVDTALFDITANPGVFDMVGDKIPSTNLFAIRGNQESQFSANVPMFSAHAQLDEYEHLFVFNRYVEDSISSGTLYHPFSGSRVVTYKFNGRRQAANTFRPEFGGHYIAGASVRQNLQASTDNITNFYDPNRAFESDLTTRHALALLGFNTKSYFDNLDISDKSQFNFWRGLIQAKGTNLSISAYLNNNRFEDAKIDEYWAYKVATYGDARQNTYPELKLQVADTVQQFTQLQFDAVTPLANFTQITRYDEDRWFTLDDLDQDTFFKAEVIGTYTKVCTAGEQVKLPFIADRLILTNATQLNATTLVATAAGVVAATGYGPATPRYNPVKLFNYVANELVEEIPMWHPAMGQHTPVALESLNVISNENPAKYNYSTQVVNNNKYDPLRPWGSNELGRTWFDTRNLAYIPYYDETIFPTRAERLSRWGALADYGTIDVYEWVQSSVPPSEYNALAAAQAGDGDLDPNTKAAGEVALEESYYRDRQWSIRPIAWSYLATPYAGDRGAVIPFGVSISDPKVQFHDDGFVSILSDTETPTFKSVGVQAGVGVDMRIGAWYLGTPQMPVGEYKIENLFSKMFIGPTTGRSITLTAAAAAGVRPAVSVVLSSPISKAAEHIALVGDLVFSAVDPNSTYTITYDADGLPLGGEVSIQVRCRKATGEYEIVELGTYSGVVNSAPLFGTTITLTAGDVIPVDFVDFGFSASVTIGTSGTFPTTAIQEAIVLALGSLVSVRDAVQVTEVVMNDSAAPITLSNNLDDHAIPGDSMIGWAAWTVPTQAQLDADGKYPTSSWRPYVGEYVTTAGTYDQIQDALDTSTKRTLNDGTTIDRYSTDWSDWNLLSNQVITKTQDASVAGPLVITHTEDVNSALTSVYVNGIAQLTASYTIETNTVTLNSVKPGSVGTVIIRHYEPTAEELAFNPDVEDDLSFQRQYKNDYEYVSLPVRDTEGSISSTLYYFWVKNKSIAAKSKNLSIQSIAQNLRDGPANYLTFQNLLDPIAATVSTPALPYRYDAITISGLSYVVGKDDTYKLRFTRNFTLRDDPQNLDLKDTHTEWSLIRPGQRTRIPEGLWQKLTDSVAGQDAAGNAVPALRRELYDERTGNTTKYGFGAEQTLAPRDLLVSSITQTIVNTKLINKSVPPDSNGNYPADFISFLDPDQSDEWFDSAAHARQTMTDIWTTAKPSQINEIFFAALDDILASNYELTDIFKTSRLSAYSIKVVAASSAKSSYE